MIQSLGKHSNTNEPDIEKEISIMATSQTTLSNVELHEAVGEQIARCGLSLRTKVVGAVRGACTAKKIKAASLTPAALRKAVDEVIAEFARCGMRACDKQFKPLTIKATQSMAAGCVATLNGTDNARKGTKGTKGKGTKGAKGTKGGADDMDDDNADATPPKTPATFPNSDVLAKIRALCALCAKSKDTNAKALASAVTAFFA